MLLREASELSYGYDVEFQSAKTKNVESMPSSFKGSSSCSVVILGELSVGKSALCRNFFRKNQTPNCYTRHEVYNAEDLVEDNHHVFELQISVNGSKSRIKILDVNTERQILESSCTDMFGDLQQYLEAGDGYIVTYAVTDKKTFQTAQNILKKIEEIESKEKYPIILVGNKCDLVRKRQVSTNDGIKVAEKFCVKFIETSAALNQNVDQLFEGIIKQIRLRELERASKQRNKLNPGDSPHSSLVKSRSCSSNLIGNQIAPSHKVVNQKQINVTKKKKSNLAERCFRMMIKKKSDCAKPCQDFSLL